MNETERDAANNDDFVAIPRHNLIAAFDELEAMHEVIDELKKNGFTRDEMRTFIGDEGMQQMDFDGSGHGTLAQLLRSLQSVGPDRTYLARYEEYMQDGDCILMVHAPESDKKQIAGEIMRQHSNHRVTYFGTYLIEEI